MDSERKLQKLRCNFLISYALVQDITDFEFRLFYLLNWLTIKASSQTSSICPTICSILDGRKNRYITFPGVSVWNWMQQFWMEFQVSNPINALHSHNHYARYTISLEYNAHRDLFFFLAFFVCIIMITFISIMKNKLYHCHWFPLKHTKNRFLSIQNISRKQ